MRRALVGVLGHVDHGKTALVRALTGTDTDRLPEERRRGLSILPGFALLADGDAEVELVDVPGHERFVRAMAAGASAIDAVLLVVDAREGVRAQTREHAAIARLLGIGRGVVAVTRTDLAPPEAAAGEALALLASLGLGRWPVAANSARTGDGITALRAALRDLAAPATPGEPGRAWLPVDRAFHRPGTGLVVTGALRAGWLEPGMEVEIWPGGGTARIRGLQSHGRALDAAGPGRRLAVALRGGEAGPGDALASPGLLREAAVLDAMVEATAPLRRGERLRLLCGTAEREAVLRLLDGPVLEGGGTAPAQLLLDAPLAVPVRARFLLRRSSPAATVGGGVVLDAEAPRRRARDAFLLREIAALPVREAAARLLCARGARGMAEAPLRRLAGGALPEGAVLLAGGTTLDAGVLGEAEDALLRAVARHREADPLGPGPEARALLRAALRPGTPGEAVAARLAARGRLRLAGGRFALPGPAAALGEAERLLVAALEATWRAAGLQPPDAAAVAGDDRARLGAIRHLMAAGVLVRATDAVQRRGWLFHRDALSRARALLRPALQAAPDGLTLGECDAILGITRRHGVPLMERLDAEGFTRRVGDRRVLHGLAEADGNRTHHPRCADPRF